MHVLYRYLDPLALGDGALGFGVQGIFKVCCPKALRICVAGAEQGMQKTMQVAVCCVCCGYFLSVSGQFR